MAEAKRGPIAMIRDSIRRDTLVKYEDFSDIISEAERSGNPKPLIQEYMRRRAAAEAPDFSGMTEADRAAEAERLRREALDKARRLRMEGHSLDARRMEVMARIVDFDPKQSGEYCTRLYSVDHASFDLDEESPHGPMRFTDQVYRNEGDYEFKLCEAINILSVKIASSDVGFPIHVYGTVIARDSIDYKCLYLFRRDRDHCQLINSKDESLILTGPKRGLMLLDNNFIEIDLKIKDHLGQDRELSKGILTIDGIASRSEECVVESESLDTRLSTVDVMYAFVKHAVEATIAIECVQGDFYGEITAYTTGIRDSLVLYGSKLAGVMTGVGKGAIELLRPVVSVCVMDMLYIVVRTGDGKSERTIEFTPRVNGGEQDEIFVGVTKMRVKVTWSIMDFLVHGSGLARC